MAPSDGTRSIPPKWKLVVTLPPLLEVRTPIAIAIWGKMFEWLSMTCLIGLAKSAKHSLIGVSIKVHKWTQKDVAPSEGTEKKRKASPRATCALCLLRRRGVTLTVKGGGGNWLKLEWRGWCRNMQKERFRDWWFCRVYPLKSRRKKKGQPKELSCCMIKASFVHQVFFVCLLKVWWTRRFDLDMVTANSALICVWWQSNHLSLHPVNIAQREWRH